MLSKFQISIDIFSEPSSRLSVEVWQLKDSFRQIKPNPAKDINKHRQWNQNYGNKI